MERKKEFGFAEGEVYPIDSANERWREFRKTPEFFYRTRKCHVFLHVRLYGACQTLMASLPVREGETIYIRSSSVLAGLLLDRYRYDIYFSDCKRGNHLPEHSNSLKRLSILLFTMFY